MTPLFPAVAALLAVSPAAAPEAPGASLCSIATEDGKPYSPTRERTERLVPESDAIVRAVAERAFDTEAGSRGTVELRVLEVLKGEGVPQTLQVTGFLSDRDDFNRESVPYVWVRRAGQSGPCYAYEYRRGGEFLLLLKQDGGGLTPYWAVFSPTNEQVRGAGDPWVQWVRERLGLPRAAIPASR